MNDSESIVEMFRSGDLVFTNPELAKANLTDDEIVQADRADQLIGAQGTATLFGNCAKCGWKGHEHFTIGDEERDMAYFDLEDAHDASSPKACKAELSFNERSR